MRKQFTCNLLPFLMNTNTTWSNGLAAAKGITMHLQPTPANFFGCHAARWTLVAKVAKAWIKSHRSPPFSFHSAPISWLKKLRLRPDTLAFSYRANATAGAGEVAAMAEQKKLIKYDSLAPNYDIAPVAIESLGAIGPLSRALLKDLGRRIKESTGEARAHEYLVQRLAVAVQRGNAVSIMGTMGDPGKDFFG